MLSNLDHRAMSFGQRFSGGRLYARDVISIVLVGTAACGLTLFGFDALLMGHPEQAEAHAPAAPSTQTFTVRDLGPYVGTWVSEAGAHIIVAKSGAVWADGDGLIGAARLDVGNRKRLLFEGATFRCSYTIAAEPAETPKPGALVWTVTDATPGTACPHGRYNRRFTF